MFIFSCPQGLKWNTDASSCRPRETESAPQFMNNMPVARSFTPPANIQPIQPVTARPMQQFQSIAVQPTARPIEQFQPVQTMISTFTTPRTTLFTTLVTEPQTQQVIQTTMKPIESSIAPVKQTQATESVSSNSFVPIKPNKQFSHSPKAGLSIEKVFGSERCGNVRISNSPIALVNGLYTKMDTGLYKRSDDLRSPGLIMGIDDKWCISYSFSRTTVDSLNLKSLSENCGANLDCCLLISDNLELVGLANPKRAWTSAATHANHNLKIECDLQEKSKPCFFCCVVS